MPDFFGDEGESEQLGLYSGLQQQAEKDLFGNPINQNQTYQAGNSYLQNLLSNSPNAYAASEAPYLQQFQQQVIPQIAERFAGMGTGAGGLNSSALNQTLAQAGSGLQNQLAALRQQMQGQAAGQGLQYSQQPISNLQTGLGLRPFENIYKPPTTGIGQSLLGGAAGAAAGFAIGGPAGAAYGGFKGLGKG